MTSPVESLQSSLAYQPRELQFGTSGRRGRIVDLTQLEVYINVTAELEYLQSLPASEGGIHRGDQFLFARDLRPSSDQFVPGEAGRGEIAQTVVAAIRAAGMHATNLGCIPTPALTNFALAHHKGSIMVTGSHIPFDRNGYKTNSSKGELLKHQEEPINARVREVRERIYQERQDRSLFDAQGFFKTGHQDLPAEHTGARFAWIERFTNFFQKSSLKGARVLVYQHSAVGRDLLVEILERMGASVIAAGRSDTFVPIDTENIGAPELAVIQSLADEAAAKHGPLFAIVSTDGDSDRPLVLGVDPLTGKARFFGGDLLGMVVAEYLKADAVVVPISCNDAVDRGSLASAVEPKTRIGSPYVIAGMEAAREKGKRRVCGWEPNGGFLTGSDIDRDGAVLSALLTRDATLPILCALFAAVESGLSLIDLFARLPKRFTRAALLKNFPRSVGLQMVERFSPHAGGTEEELGEIRRRLAEFFRPGLGFAGISRIDYTDGVRIYFDNGEVVHIRPSGNADELRIYAAADTQERADTMAAMGIAEPGGILRSIEKSLSI